MAYNLIHSRTEGGNSVSRCYMMLHNICLHNDQVEWPLRKKLHKERCQMAAGPLQTKGKGFTVSSLPLMYLGRVLLKASKL